MLGKGRAEAITPAHMAALADEIGCHPAHLEAIAKVESGGFGWFRDGRIKILFEKHIFYKYLKGAQRDRAVKEGLARSKWISPKNGGYKEQKTADQRYSILDRAMKINRDAALMSMSVGRYQICLFNWKKCGFESPLDMWEQFLDSEVNQLRAFKNFLINSNLKKALIDGNFERVERVYNGGGLNGVYARRMKSEAAKLKRGKWKGYKPGSMRVDPPRPAPKPQVNVAAKSDASTTIPKTTTGEKGGAVAGAVVAIGGGLAAAWHNGLWVLLSVLGIGAIAFIVYRIIKRK